MLRRLRICYHPRSWAMLKVGLGFTMRDLWGIWCTFGFANLDSYGLFGSGRKEASLRCLGMRLPLTSFWGAYVWQTLLLAELYSVLCLARSSKTWCSFILAGNKWDDTWCCCFQITQYGCSAEQVAGPWTDPHWLQQRWPWQTLSMGLKLWHMWHCSTETRSG